LHATSFLEPADNRTKEAVVPFNRENGAKVAKLARDFGIPTTTVTTVSKNKENISHFFLSECTRKHDTVSGNPNQRTLLTLAKLWH